MADDTAGDGGDTFFQTKVFFLWYYRDLKVETGMCELLLVAY